MMHHVWFRNELYKIAQELRSNESPDAAKQALDQLLVKMIYICNRSIQEQGL